MKAQNNVDLKEEAIKEAIRLYLIKMGRDVSKVEIASIGANPISIGVSITENVASAKDRNQSYVITPKGTIKPARMSSNPVNAPKPRGTFVSNQQEQKDWFDKLLKSTEINGNE